MPHVSPTYPHRRTPDLDRAETHHPVVVAGGGLVGLTIALDLARRGVRVVLLDEDDTVSTGSRAICFAKRTLEILGRLGLGDELLAKGVTWNTGKVFFRERQIYAFDLLPEAGHRYPGLRQPAAILRGRMAGRGMRGDRRSSICAGATRWSGIENRPAARVLEVETPGRALPHRARTGCSPATAPHSFIRAIARPALRGQGVPRPLPDRRRGDEGGFPERALVLVRPALPPATNPCCCTSSPTMCGGSISSSAGMPIPMRRRSRSASSRACRRCSGRTCSSSSNG